MMSSDGKRTSAEAGMDGPGMSDSEFFAMMEQVSFVENITSDDYSSVSISIRP